MEKAQIHPLQHLKKIATRQCVKHKEHSPYVFSDPVSSLYKDLTLLIVH